jgi:hypothetical protein
MVFLLALGVGAALAKAVLTLLLRLIVEGPRPALAYLKIAK